MSEKPLSFANLSNAKYIDNLYRNFLENPNLVDKSWQHFFEGVNFGATSSEGKGGDLSSYLLISAYRMYGHKGAHINPLSEKKNSDVPELALENFGLSSHDLTTLHATHGFLKEEMAPLGQILEALKATYCTTVGFEYMGLANPEMEAMIQEAIEPQFDAPLTKEEAKEILDHLICAEIFETFIHHKFPGQKRFSLEGGETLISLLFEAIETAAKLGGDEAIIGMAHRGRLNVLTNVLGKPYADIFHEFNPDHMPLPNEGSGDVKYHKGYERDCQVAGRPFHLFLPPNPSHLEAVDPVVLGNARARQERGHAGKVLPILIHGDAALAGQGIVYECLQLSGVDGYSSEGTLHIVINNQVGFTAQPEEGRSSLYCTDIAKTFSSPVFHVNAEDVPRALAACALAVKIRQKFKCDVFIDMNCYRKYGHNEADEPGFTQPKEYKVIRAKTSIKDQFKALCHTQGLLTEQETGQLESAFKEQLEAAFKEAQEQGESPLESPPADDLTQTVETGVDKTKLLALADSFCTVPDSVDIHPKLKRLYEARKAMLTKGDDEPLIDWGMGEMLTYASLLTEGGFIRLSGQDSQRGTFTHRHSMVVDQTSQEKYIPLNHLKENQPLFAAYNSPLSEYSVLGFEFGYSMEAKEGLVIWEAQFGDFANGAQIIIDQYIGSARRKWGTESSLTLLLPHGYEGQGPEHSSARIERFLQLAANESLFICNPTHPAQLFHLLRRQCHLPFRRPLIVFTPKALLRYTPSLSPLSAFTQGSFQEVLDDPNPPEAPKRLIMVSGKIYYDLIAEREKRQATDVVICRLEQLYPLPCEKIKKLLDKYPSVEEWLWVQEEHSNMGALEHIMPQLDRICQGVKLRAVSRERSSSPAAGTKALHEMQHRKLMEDVFNER